MVAQVADARRRLSIAPADLALWLGLAALGIPTLVRMANFTWTREFGAYGPIVLATGGWLLWRQIPEMRRLGSPGRWWITAPLLIASLGGYVFGRAYDYLPVEALGVYGAGLSILHFKMGARVMVHQWFPLLYLAFAIPAPNTVLTDLTAPLKQFVSQISTDWLHSWGIPVARQGVTIFVAQYQLLVEDACSGMNSIVGLIAVSLLYIYLMRGSSWVYSVILLCFVIPIAILANIFRIMILILLTFFYGDEVAQGFLHFTAGMLLFTTALVCVFALDRLITYGASKLRRGT